MKKSNGFTLIELMVTVAVAALMLALAIPSFRDQIEKRRLIGAAEVIYEKMMEARTEAVARSKPIVLHFDADSSDQTIWSFGMTDDVQRGACNSAVTSVTGTNPCTIEYDNDPTTDCFPTCGISDGDPLDLVLMRWDNAEFDGIELRGRDNYYPSFSGNLRQVCYDNVSGQALAAPEACFEPLAGMGRNGSVVLCTDDTYELQVVVAALGRARICSPAAHDGTHASCGHTAANYRQVPGYPDCDD